MSKREMSSIIRLHEDTVLFREAVNFTASQTLFLPRLIEKDYYCTVLLDHLAAADSSLVFKGGTCLAKVHAGFYRLSEDLDFVIPTPLSASRSERRNLAAGFKKAVIKLPTMVGAFRVLEPPVGANNSKQYVAVIGYRSLISKQEEIIKIEVGLREPLLTQILTTSEVRTILLDPISGEPMVRALTVPCISRSEAMAEKLRAALSRHEVAIRDFFDIVYAVRNFRFNPLEATIIEMVRQKLAVEGNEPVDVSPDRLASLRQKLDSQLKPVLRVDDFVAFDLD
ncbi:MAG: nucleotidyl transferase AbiEii/AbiGii toxin family protein [Syntrophales bacterium]